MTQTTVFHLVRIFDGARVLPADSVVVQESTIMAVGSDLALPTGTTVIDGTGQTLLPGLIDAHTHIFGPAQVQLSKTAIPQRRNGYAFSACSASIGAALGES